MEPVMKARAAQADDTAWETARAARMRAACFAPGAADSGGSRATPARSVGKGIPGKDKTKAAGFRGSSSVPTLITFCGPTFLDCSTMAIKKSELYSSLWAGCDELRGGMDASQYKD
jgi:hypothetical protein